MVLSATENDRVAARHESPCDRIRGRRPEQGNDLTQNTAPFTFATARWQTLALNRRATRLRPTFFCLRQADNLPRRLRKPSRGRPYLRPDGELSNASDFALEFFLGIVGGLDRETDAALDLVDFDDPRFDLLADLENVFHLGDVIFAELRDMDEAIDVILQLHKRAKAGELGYLAVDEIADLVFLVDVLPRIVARVA